MNRNKNKSRQKQLSGAQEERKHIVLPDLQLAKVKEPKPVCAICSKTIDFISLALSEGEDRYSHFDCVLNKISQEHDVKAPDKVSYLGSGCFGIISFDEEGKFTIKEKIWYENSESFSKFKKMVEANRNE